MTYTVTKEQAGLTKPYYVVRNNGQWVGTYGDINTAINAIKLIG